MKISLTYGFFMALGTSLVSLVFFFTGFHEDPTKLQTAQNISLALNTAIAIVCIILGMREKRSLTPSSDNWGYGSALGMGLLVSIWGTLFATIYTYGYFAFINPAINDVIHQAQVLKMQESGASAADIERVEPMMRKMMNPVVMTITSFFMILIFNAIISLVGAIFVKNRPATAEATV